MKKGQKRSLLVVALLLLVGVTAYFGASTYAKYASEITGNSGTATVAKWNFTGDNNNVTFDIDLTGTYQTSSLVEGKIAPGTKGQFEVELSNATSETGVAFTMSLSNVTNAPTNLVFYTDDQYNEVFDPTSDTITGKIAQAGSITVPVYWAWAFGTVDTVSDTENQEDTANGMNPQSMQIEVTVVGVQTNPTETVTTGLD